MAQINLAKLEFDEWFNSSTMFYVNQAFENKMDKIIEDKVGELYLGLSSINSKDALCKYIINNKDALENLTSLLEISTERFKRIVSMIRKDQGYTFNTEWSLRKVRTVMLDSQRMMDLICDLIWEGKNDEKLKKKIPSFYLENMIMNEVTLSKLKDKNSIRLFIKRGLEGKYSNGIGDAVLKDIETEISNICASKGLDYTKNIYLPMLKRSVSFAIEKPEDPKIIIDASYCVTTSSSQSMRRESIVKAYEEIKRQRQQGKKCCYVNFLDGAGWVGRQSDIREIIRCSDYVVNFQNLGQLKDIISSITN